MDIDSQTLQLADFMDLFSGDIHNYGVHHYKFNEGSKETGKNTTVTNKLLTIEQYKDHILGNVGLGVIPIDEHGDVKFGVIDVDVYDTSFSVYLNAIETIGFPLVPFRSKSGGLHLYMFLKQPTNAKIVIDILNNFITLLGIDLYVKHRLNRIIEVFPKQLKKSDNAVGSWINMPYFDAEHTQQYAMRNGQKLTLSSALTYCKEKRCSIGDARAFIFDLPDNDGPPCLQTVMLLNALDENSGRNNFLFSYAVFMKKKDPEFWEQRLYEINDEMAQPLPKAELEATIISSLRRKDYAYKCNEIPCVDYCRKLICKTRKFGVGKEGGYFSELDFGKLSQVKAYEPYYEWDVKIIGDDDYKCLRFKNEADIIGQDAFLRLCFRELHILPIKMKQSEWYKLINQALSNIEIVGMEREDDTTPIGLFRSLFTEFLTERAMAQTKDQILNKRVFYEKTAERYLFRAVDLTEFLFVTKNFKYFTPGELHGLLKDLGAISVRIKTESEKQLRVYCIALKDVYTVGPLVSEIFKAEFKANEETF